MLSRALTQLAFWGGLTIVTTACNRYEVAPGYEAAARTPAPPECFERPGSITPGLARDSTPLDSVVAGTVLDERGRPVSSALITLVSESERRASTDSAGRFQLARPPHGKYRLEVRALGYNRASAEIPVSEGVPQVYAVVLPVLMFDGGPCSAIVLVKKPWWKWW